MNQDLLHQLQDRGVSVWLDGVTRAQLRSGELAALVRDLGVSGVTTNPTLFAASLADAREYENDLADLAARHVTPAEAARVLAAADVRSACDTLLPTYQQTSGAEGWVSLEVDPGLADNAYATLAEVRALRWLVDRPNVMIKIPATTAGIAAIMAATGEGHSINATLIFSVERYREVLGAYTAGLERARADGLDTSGIHSVASLFVSRVDAALAASTAPPPAVSSAHRVPGDQDNQVATPRSPFALAGIANAREAHRSYQAAMTTEAWRTLLADGANPQRPLWASTGVKDPELDPTTYAVGLAIPGTVATLPMSTLLAAAAASPQALRDGSDPRDTRDLAHGRERLNAAGESLMTRLLDDGVTKFRQSWASVLDTLEQQLGPAQRPTRSAS